MSICLILIYLHNFPLTQFIMQLIFLKISVFIQMKSQGSPILLNLCQSCPVFKWSNTIHKRELIKKRGLEVAIRQSDDRFSPFRQTDSKRCIDGLATSVRKTSIVDFEELTPLHWYNIATLPSRPHKVELGGKLYTYLSRASQS